MSHKWRVSSPGTAGFDEWLATQAEASSSMSNCGCFPVNHSDPGPPPPAGYKNHSGCGQPLNKPCAGIVPHGDHCVVGGGVASDWCYKCTDYYAPNASDVRGVTPLQELGIKERGDDSELLIDRFEVFLHRTLAQKRPFYAHLCLHSIHEPHPAMPKYYAQYRRDPDYLGTLTQMDVQIGRLMDLLEQTGVSGSTVVFYTSDNGPHKGLQRSDILYSTQYLRQCKASIFEGGIRVPGILHAPMLISRNLNISIPVFTGDILPTMMALLQVESDNPSWVMDGLSLLERVRSPTAPRPTPIPFSFAGQSAIVDNDMKIMNTPAEGQCPGQAPYFSPGNPSPGKLEAFYLFNISADRHELHDLKSAMPLEFARMKRLYDEMLVSILHSALNETGCARLEGHPPPSSLSPSVLVQRQRRCEWEENTGLNGGDLVRSVVMARREDCGRACAKMEGCAAADWNGGRCFLKARFRPFVREGGSACAIVEASS